MRMFRDDSAYNIDISKYYSLYNLAVYHFFSFTLSPLQVVIYWIHEQDLYNLPFHEQFFEKNVIFDRKYFTDFWNQSI